MFRPSNLPHTICYSADTEHLFSWKKRQIMIAFKRLSNEVIVQLLFHLLIVNTRSIIIFIIMIRICRNRITLIRCDCQKFVEQVVHCNNSNYDDDDAYH
ncbi:hypothetical protein T08_13509 [Trichinella sp. T8]|nr:hypothetical protein T08_13509 [Trichinella sp. T8]